LSGKLQEQLNQWDKILSVDLTGFTRTAERQKIPVVEVGNRK
jgi:hypothetical protein